MNLYDTKRLYDRKQYHGPVHSDLRLYGRKQLTLEDCYGYEDKPWQIVMFVTEVLVEEQSS